MKGPKIKDIVKGVRIGSEIGKMFLPGAAGSILDKVNKVIGDNGDPKNEAALRHLADVDDQLVQVLKEHEARLRALEEK
jgi:hypothetical protein